MTEELPDDETLLRRLGSNDPFDRQAAIALLRQRALEDLLPLAKHAVPAVRSGFVEAVAGLDAAPLGAVFVELAGDADVGVRQALATALTRHPDWALPDEALVRLTKDEMEEVSLPAIEALAKRPSQVHVLVRLGRADDASWAVQKAANRAVASLANADDAIRLTLETLAATRIEVIARECAEHVEERLPADGDWDGSMPAGALPSADTLITCGRAVRSWDENALPRLRKLLERHAPSTPNLKELASFGRNLTEEARCGKLHRGFHVSDAVDALQRAIHGKGNRSAALVGPSGTGRTAAVYELTHRLLSQPGTPWHVFRVLPSELLVGTKYLGEWQTRVKELVSLCAPPQRVVLYFPGITELAEVGLSSDNDMMSAASMLAPEIESGRLVVIGEATPERWGGGGEASGLQRSLQRIEMRPMDRDTTRATLELVALEAGTEVTPAALDVVLEVADVYLTETELPGRAVGLLRRMIACDEGERRVFDRADVLNTLEEATGVPPTFLDDSIPLSLERVRQFLGTRVMGQVRAVEQVIDLVTLVKAGLDDPAKPSGVMLFVGPTGVGKTELSRALAELMFGDPARLLRFDMSEYASYESFQRLIGDARNPGTLTEAVRRQPFAVVLLDEIEKAHPNVFDLCLQIFDAGRLTDGAGRTVSFSKCIVIMTSNLGARVATEAGIGFDGRVPPPPGDDEIQRALSMFFRPEFLGRIDHVVRFDALSPETADRIARREVKRVLARGGLARRGVTVDVDPGVFGHVLRAGYSPALGARPLKRTVESLVLMPVARVLATEPTRPGSVVQLRLEGGAVEARLLPPDDEDAAPSAPVGTPRLDEELARLERLEAAAGPARERYERAVAATHVPDFWDDTSRAAAILDEIHRLEDVLDRLDGLRSELERTAANPNAARAERYLERHAADARRLERLLTVDDLGDAYVRLTGIGSRSTELDGVERFARMYMAWARREGLDATVLDDRAASAETEDTITLRIEGPGARARLAGEAGLHKLRHVRVDGSSVRAMVRVEILPVPATPPAFAPTDLEVDTRPLYDEAGRVATTLLTDVHILHRPTMTAVRAASPLAPDMAIESVSGLLAALVAADAAPLELNVVRRYRFGRAPLVRDARTGRSTGRVDRVLGGDLSLVGEA